MSSEDDQITEIDLCSKCEGSMNII